MTRIWISTLHCILLTIHALALIIVHLMIHTNTLLQRLTDCCVVTVPGMCIENVLGFL